jgi:Fic family protein
MYVYQQADWPRFHWNHEALMFQLAEVRNMQGRLMGKMESLGFELRNEAVLRTLTIEILKSTEIEGEVLEPQQVRSSLARRLGMDIAGLVHSGQKVDGVVDMTLDATQEFESDLTEDRLFGWHSALFPTGRSGMYRIRVGSWRDDSTGPMQVVSGPMGKERVHFQAPAASHIETEVQGFLSWFNGEDNLDPVLKAGLAHFWFITIHPFDDGNGRIARALTDMLLARSDGSAQRFYSMSARMQLDRKEYYAILERSQKGTLDITEWLRWFLDCLRHALNVTALVLAMVLDKDRFWRAHAKTIISHRQKVMINRLLDGFNGKLTSSKWAKLTKCSPDTALRDISDLINKQILLKAPAGGRSTSYDLLRPNE